MTQLADAVACARRYQLLHELRLEERPDPEPELPDPLGPEADAPATSLGTLAHRLLELVPLGLQGVALRTELDSLVLGSQILDKAKQPALQGDVDWRNLYALD